MSLPAPLPLEDAQRRLLDLVTALGSENLPVADALGRCLAQPVLAQRRQPAADLSAMDGYAMRIDDLAGPWQVIGESAAGHPFPGGLQRGEAIRISTGALMPTDGGAVLLQEEALRDGDHLALAAGGEATARHIRHAGFDFQPGMELLRAGQRIGPAQLALALSGGHVHLPVARLPRIAVIDSGDELSTNPTDCATHQIPASNGAMLAAMVAPYSSSIDRIGPVADDMAALAQALKQAEAANVIVTSGGASVGDHDLIRPALAAWGAEIDFWRVAMKPGKPLLVARRGHQFILGLPGNPISSYVTAFLFLLPLLRAMGGAERAVPRPLTLPLRGTLPAVGNRLEFVRARMDGDGVAPLTEQDSSALAALARADVLIRREIGAVAATDGHLVAAYLLNAA
ncbi:molybdopterin molybdenumtransferase MoeA [Altererythrobacter xixiisoli]|uniref:Molybdopterin molybdenumtransferase n=1 Tax=Croceibacterium xixiisoli TaxID=1476466 RepID=A0A6I4TXF0_9SPHN|nr:molybdopterin molybdotransferase MoeA [Croceibacterium xixiisoli]MXO99910.1 molybdopterin molybdenumtransferase MoeA [Croceibacterium xixiisoli]